MTIHHKSHVKTVTVILPIVLAIIVWKDVATAKADDHVPHQVDKRV